MIISKALPADWSILIEPENPRREWVWPWLTVATSQHRIIASVSPIRLQIKKESATNPYVWFVVGPYRVEFNRK